MSVFDLIRAQQGKERTAVWMVGEQLMDILLFNRFFNIRKLHGCIKVITRIDVDRHPIITDFFFRFFYSF